MQLPYMLNETLTYIKKNDPAIITLRGDLGAGKTYFTAQLGQILGAETKITSPSFSLLDAHPIKFENKHTLIHCDFYRITEDESSKILEQVNFWDYISQGHVVIIEWPERIASFIESLPSLNIKITDRDNIRNYTLYA